MKKLLLINLITFCLISVANAQNFPFGKYTDGELAMTNYKNDETAKSVVLNEFGETKFFLGRMGKMRITYTYHVRIKVFDTTGFKHAKAEVPLFDSGIGEETPDEVDEIRAITIAHDNKGGVATKEIDNILDVKKTPIDKNHKILNFTLANVTNGCIIEYTYTLSTYYLDQLHDWQFQADIPKVRSEYQVHIPAFYNYSVALRGALKLTKNTTDKQEDCFKVNLYKSDCIYSVYEIDDVPSFTEAPYITASKNFKSAIYFQLIDYTDLYLDKKVKVQKEWKELDQELKLNDNFGAQLKRKDLLKSNIAPAITSATDASTKAHAVYNFIKQNIKWNNLYSTTTDGIVKALNKHTGNVADVNLALVSALNSVGLHADPVLLSTRDHGIVNESHPVIAEFNYVIAKVEIDGTSYLLDATDPLLPFGILPLRCLNNKGRVMSMDKDSYWVDLMVNQRQSSTSILNLTLQQSGKLTGKFYINSYGYAAYEKRKAIKKFNTTARYAESLDKTFAKVKILSSEINNVDSLDMLVNETYEVEIDVYDNLNQDRLPFNPYLFKQIVSTPFNLEDRTYPVDLGMSTDTKFILTLTLPDGLSVENPPQVESFALPDQAGKFTVTYQPDGNTFTFINTLSLKKPVYTVDEYPSLKELYNKIISSEKSEMVFKKKI